MKVFNKANNVNKSTNKQFVNEQVVNRKFHKKLRLNKKADFDLVYYIIRALMVGVVLTIFFLEFSFFNTASFNSGKIDQILIKERIINGPLSISKIDEAGQQISGTVDLKKFTDSYLKEIFSTSNSLNVPEDIYGARLRLYNSYIDAIQSNYFREAFINQKFTTSYVELARAGLSSSGGATYYYYLQPVVLYYGSYSDLSGQSEKNKKSKQSTQSTKSKIIPPKLVWLSIEIIKKS